MNKNTIPNVPKVALTPLNLIKIWWAWLWRGSLILIFFSLILRSFLYIFFLFLNIPDAIDDIDRYMLSDFQLTIYNYQSMNDFIIYALREILTFFTSFFVDYVVLRIIVGWEFKSFVLKLFPPDTQGYKRKVMTLAWAWAWRSAALVIPYTFLLNHLASSALHWIFLFIGVSIINIVTLKIVLQKQFKNFKMILEALPPKSRDS